MEEYNSFRTQLSQYSQFHEKDIKFLCYIFSDFYSILQQFYNLNLQQMFERIMKMSYLLNDIHIMRVTWKKKYTLFCFFFLEIST